MAAAGTRWNEPLGLIGRIGIVPVVTIDDIDATVPLVRAVVDGGLTVVEITLRTSAGMAAISRAVADLPDAVVGAGSVMTADATIAAIEAGARFIVSPGLDDGVIAAARARGVAILPGVGTATELMRAVAMDVDTVKLFPADALGGPAFVRALSAVLARRAIRTDRRDFLGYGQRIPCVALGARCRRVVDDLA